MPEPRIHLDDLEREERMDWLDDVEVEEVAPRPWVVSDDDRARMSQQELLDHPEHS